MDKDAVPQDLKVHYILALIVIFSNLLFTHNHLIHCR